MKTSLKKKAEFELKNYRNQPRIPKAKALKKQQR